MVNFKQEYVQQLSLRGGTYFLKSHCTLKIHWPTSTMRAAAVILLNSRNIWGTLTFFLRLKKYDLIHSQRQNSQ